MIGRISGTLIEKNPPSITVDVQGLGYEVDVPMSTFYNLPATAKKCRCIPTSSCARTRHFLYGFGTEGERAAFRQLLKISGIGARTALAVLSGMSVTELAQAVTAAGRRAADQGAGHRQEDRRAPAAGAARPAAQDLGTGGTKSVLARRPQTPPRTS
jgi:Holliday junction DNA helicase RuvA